MTGVVAERSRALSRVPRWALLLAALAIATATAGRLMLLAQPIGGDPGIYAYIGGRILAGDLPYRDMFEQKPPGILYTYAAAFWLFGRSMVAVQALDLAAWVALLALTPLLVHALWRDRPATLLAAVLVAVFVNPTLQSSFKQVGQTETFVSVWATAGLWLAIRAGRARSGSGIEASRSPLAPIVASGACCGMAALYKYNAVTYLLACAATIWVSTARRPSVRSLGALAVGFALPIGVATTYFWRQGALTDLIEATVLYNLAYTAGSSGSVGDFLARAAVMTYRFGTMNFLWMAGGAGLLAILWRWRRGDASGAPLVWFSGAAYVAMLANAKFYPQYFLQLLPPLAALSAWGLTLAWRATWGRGRHALALALLAAIGVTLGRHTAFSRLAREAIAATQYATGRLPVDEYYVRFGGYGDGGDFSLLADYQLAQKLREGTRSVDPVFIYGGEPLVLFLADRRSPSRFVWNDPFLAGAYRGRYTHRDLTRELDAAPPAYFIVLRNDENLIDPVDSLTHFRADADLQAYVRARYREVGWFEDFLIFERRGRGGPGARDWGFGTGDWGLGIGDGRDAAGLGFRAAGG